MPPRKRPSRKFPRLIIERVTPELDSGRWAVKRCVGDRVEIGADVIKDGHDLVQARIRYRGPHHPAWQYAPMTYDYGTDRWHGAILLDAVGQWTYSVEAWADVFGTWRSELEKKVEAGQDVATELTEGALLIETAAGRARGEARAALNQTLAFLREPGSLIADRVHRALSEPLQRLLEVHVDHRDTTHYARDLLVTVDRERARFGAWYELFPRSQATAPGAHGTFADVERRLPRLAELGFDVLYLPPIHPIGHSHRKGRNNSVVCEPGDPGSPWAIGSEAGGHIAIEPRLGTIDDFDQLVAAAEDAGIEIALDYALQCSPDHPWVREHPDWFFIRPDGSIKYAENPPKKYQDIYPLNFWCDDREGLWNACRDIVLYWMEHGVRIFRVDNPHTKPLTFWEWMIAEIRGKHPDVLFLAEAFTRPKRMQVLAKLGFSQSYTYFTWRNAAWELRQYLSELATESADFLRPNFFANTPDILHEFLQKGGPPAFRIRLLLAATLSPTYGIYSGFELCENTPVKAGSEEYLDSEKYEIRTRDWEAPGNLNDEIRLINRIRRENAALRQLTNISFHPSDNDRILFFRKSADDGSNDLLIAVNLDPLQAQATTVHVPLDALRLPPDNDFGVEDLLTGARYTWHGTRNYVRLDPAEQVAHILRVVR